MSIPSTGIPPASIAAPTAPAGGGLDILGLLTQLLGGNYAPTGLGTRPPTALGPNPVREVDPLAMGRGGEANQSGMQSFWQMIAPFIALMGGGSQVMPGAGSVSISDPTKNFLQAILTSVLSPASAAPTAGALPSAGAPVPAPAGVTGGGTVPTSFAPTGGGGTDFGGFGGSMDTGGGGKIGGAPGAAEPGGRGNAFM